MKYTSSLKAPVVTFLSTSPSLSRRSQAIFRAFFALEPISLSDSVATDEMNQLFTSRVPGMNLEWDSVASICQFSGTVLHFLSTKSPEKSLKEERLSLLSITNAESKSGSDSVKAARGELAWHISQGSHLNITSILLAHAIGRPPTVAQVLSLDGGLPLLQLGKRSEMNSTAPTQSTDFNKGLREVAIPVYDDSEYRDGSTLLSHLSASSLRRPTVGVYQFPNNGVALRPLPAGKEDRLIPAPSLVFYSPNLDETKERLSRNGLMTAKIGYSGTSRHGQLMVSHPDLPGLDVRLTETTSYLSSFAEAQEALMAGSLDDLQNVNVLLEGGKEARAQNDAMNGLGDCWVEFRANLKKPTGFFKRNSARPTEQRKTAKAPDIPYD
jgi:hypothetical protein